MNENHTQDVPAFLRGAAPRVGLTKADAAYAEIRARILACELRPGSVVDQDMIAGWLGSSTTPVREALRRLEAEKLVVVRAHSEVRVAPASLEEFREFHAIRMGLETMAAEIAAATISEAQVAELRAFMTAAPAPTDQGINLDRSRLFHRAIYAASENKELIQILDSIWDRLGRYRVMLAGKGSVSTCNSPEHQAIVAAIAAGQRKTASKLMRADLESSYRAILPNLEAALADFP